MKSLVLGITLAAGLVACSDGLAPGQAPALEPVSFQSIGSGKLMFQRIGAGGAYTTAYVVDADARTTMTALDSVESLVFTPSLSPQGDRVAWLRWTDEAGFCYDVYTTDLTGANPERLSAYPCNKEGPPAWAPSGLAVVFMTNMWGNINEWGIYVSALGPGVPVKLWAFALDPAGTMSCPATLPTLAAGQLAVSAIGAVAYACGTEIWGAPTTTDSLRRIRPASGGQVAALAWSPNAASLAFVEISYGVDNRLVSALRILDLATGAERTITTVDGSAGSFWHGTGPASVCWLRGGQKLAFTAPGPGGGSGPGVANVHIVGADGTGLVKLTTDPDVFDHHVSCSL